MTRPLDIGSALPRARRAAGISQRELGAALGVAQQQVARWEASGYRNASLERVDAVAEALGYEIVRLPPVLRARPDTAAAESDASLAAEPVATYGAAPPVLADSVRTSTAAVAPVRDLGEITARIRAHGRELTERFGIVRIGVFGSFAYGEQTGESDVDLLVDMPTGGGFLFVEAADYAEQILGRKVDFVESHALHPRMQDRVLREAVYVWAA